MSNSIHNGNAPISNSPRDSKKDVEKETEISPKPRPQIYNAAKRAITKYRTSLSLTKDSNHKTYLQRHKERSERIVHGNSATVGTQTSPDLEIRGKGASLDRPSSRRSERREKKERKSHVRSDATNGLPSMKKSSSYASIHKKRTGTKTSRMRKAISTLKIVSFPTIRVTGRSSPNDGNQQS